MKAMKFFGAFVMGCAMLLAVSTLPVPVAAEEAQLSALWGEMTDGDRSAMKTAAGKVGTTLQSVKGSANAKFWGELSGLGLMRNVSLVELFGQQAEAFEKAGLVAFAITPKGVETIPGIIDDLEKK